MTIRLFPQATRVVALGVILSGFTPTLTGAQTAADATSSAKPAPKVVKHTVRKGDTLWDIAKFYLKDPFRWPQVFHANTDIIKNPHWIYPGQILTIDGAAVRDEVAAQVDGEGYVTDLHANPDSISAFATRRPPPPPKQGVLEKPPVFTVREGEFAAAPFLVDHTKPLGNGTIVAPVDRLALGLQSDAGFQLNDRLYVTAPAGIRVRVGDLLLLANASEVLPDMGRIVEPGAILQVDSMTADGLALGRITKMFSSVQRDASVLPFDRSYRPTTTRPAKGDYALVGKVIWIRNTPLLPSLQSYVMVNAARAQGIKPGDEFTLYDDRQIENEAGIATPPVAAARLQIVRVTPYAATGIIIGHEQPVIRPGMPVHLTAKMP